MPRSKGASRTRTSRLVSAPAARTAARAAAASRTARGPSSPLVVVDAGNTETVIGIFLEGRLHGPWRLASDADRTADEYWLLLGLLAREAGIAPDEIGGLSIGSVVPAITTAFRDVGEKRLGAKTIIVTGETNVGIRVRVDTPRDVGADRIANAVAAYRLYGGPCVVVDLGTATTFDVISPRGDYLGGAIAPGLMTSSRDLFRRAARLSAVDLVFPENVIGKNTGESMRSGILYGTVGQIDGIIARIRREWRRDFEVLATGGLAGLIAGRSAEIDKVVPDLTLQGLRLIFDRVSGRGE